MHGTKGTKMSESQFESTNSPFQLDSSSFAMCKMWFFKSITFTFSIPTNGVQIKNASIKIISTYIKIHFSFKNTSSVYRRLELQASKRIHFDICTVKCASPKSIGNEEHLNKMIWGVMSKATNVENTIVVFGFVLNIYVLAHKLSENTKPNIGLHVQHNEFERSKSIWFVFSKLFELTFIVDLCYQTAIEMDSGEF